MRNIYFMAVITSMIKLSRCSCDWPKYEINGRCCLMCRPGYSVFQHCTESASTNCTKCEEKTYTSEDNSFKKCFSCTVCDSVQGLRKKTPCTRTADTTCEALDGHYCIDQNPYSCGQAREHTKCKPGQYIKSKGTALNDTVCDWCKAGTFSNGSLETCQIFSRCEDSGLKELKPGTNTSDVVCGKDNKLLAVIGGGVVAAVVLVSLGLCVLWKRKKGIQSEPGTDPETSEVLH